jgi:hypothetical protein
MKKAPDKSHPVLQIASMLCLLLMLGSLLSACQPTESNLPDAPATEASAVPGEAPSLSEPAVSSAPATQESAAQPAQAPAETQADVVYPVLPDAPQINAKNAHNVRALGRYGEGSIYNVFWSQDDRQLVLATTTGIYLLDRTADPTPRYFSAHTFIRQAVFSSGGDALIILSYDEPVRMYRLETGELMLELTQVPGEPLAVSPDGRLLATESGLWELESMQQLAAFEPQANSVTFSSDSTLMAVDRQIWSLENGQASLLRQLDYSEGRMVYGADFKMGILDVEEGYAIWDIQAGRQVSLVQDDSAQAY